MFFDGWESVARIALLAAATYIVVVAALRVIGEQALAKMSAYDMVVTIALGSLLVGIPLSADVTLVDGLVVIATVLLLQEGSRLLVKRSPRAGRLIRQRPHLLVWNGQLLHDRLDKLNVIEEEVRAAVRRASLASLAEAQAVVLETDGEWSVIPRGKGGDFSALVDFKEVTSQKP
jgi:uncharacterized membrane protein YcaP (DUF421 family)